MATTKRSANSQLEKTIVQGPCQQTTSRNCMILLRSTPVQFGTRSANRVKFGTTFLLLILCIGSGWSFPAFSSAVKIRLPFEAETLDWNEGDVPIHVINNAMEGLYRVSTSGSVKPCEALDEPHELTPSHWQVKLLPNLHWSNGQPLTAEDYVYSWTRLKDPKVASSYSYLFKDIVSFRAVETDSLEIVTAKNKTLDPALLTHWVTFPLSKAFVEKAGTNRWTKNIPAIPVNGPYKFAKGSLETGFELVPNPHHRKPGKLKRVEFVVVTEDSTAFRLYEAGKLQFMTDLAGLDRKKILKHPDYHAAPGPVLVYLGIDGSEPILSTAEKRQALSNAIDRKQLEELLDGQGATTVHLVPNEKAPQPAANQQQLKRFDAQTEFGFFERGTNKLLVEFIQNQWKENLNLQTAIRTHDIKSYWAKLKDKPYPIFLNSYGPPVWNMAYYYGLLLSTNPMNLGRWKNAEYDNAIEHAQWHKALKIFQKEQPIIPLYFRRFEYLQKPELKGIVLNPMTSLYLQDAEYK